MTESAIAAAVMGYIDRGEVLSWSTLTGLLDQSFPTVVDSTKSKVISELVQSNLIKRIEVMNTKQNRRDFFYMSVDFRLM